MRRSTGRSARAVLLVFLTVLSIASLAYYMKNEREVVAYFPEMPGYYKSHDKMDLIWIWVREKGG